jgi:hypothetical protein
MQLAGVADRMLTNPAGAERELRGIAHGLPLDDPSPDAAALRDAENREADRALATDAEEIPSFRSLSELQANPDLLAPPEAIAPRFAYRGRTTLLAAREKIGKSTLVAELAARVSDGGFFLGERCAQGTVLWCGEENVGDVVRRFGLFGADAEAVFILDLRAFGRDRVTTVCKAIELLRPTLVVIDTLVSLTSGIVDDSSSDSQVGPHVSRIAGLAARLDLACLMNHHSTKSGSGYHGSFVYAAMVDLVLQLTAPDTEGFTTMRSVKSVGRWDTSDFAVNYDRVAHRHSLGGAQRTLAERIVEFIEGHPGCSLSDVTKGTATRKTDASEAITKLKETGAVIDSGRGKSWKLEIGGNRSGTDREPITLSLEIMGTDGNRSGTGAEPIGNRTPHVVVPGSPFPIGEREPVPHARTVEYEPGSQAERDFLNARESKAKLGGAA